ncbi:MAG: phosphorylase [Clostridia bacterium]|jgi:purine-nucleoside phosphorylase
MDYQYLIDGIRRYGSTEEDICLHGLGVSTNQVNENIVIAPWWEPSALEKLGEAEYLSESPSSAVKVWNIRKKDLQFTYIKTGIGAPVLMDAVLSLGVTRCKRAVFIGSVGSLDEKIGIGDIVIPEYSICGDGASRYIATESLKNDIFGEKAYPDKDLFRILYNNTEQVCNINNVRFHTGRTFSIDTIFAQYSHIDEIIGMGCNVIEMETAAAFRAAKIAGISLAALFSVSDNTVTNKSLISGRTEEEMQYRRYTRRVVFPEIILNTFNSM